MHRVGAIAAGSAILAGCSFLVDFTTKPAPDCEAGDCIDAPTVDAGSADASALDDGPTNVKPDAPSDVEVEAAQCANPCLGKKDGWYCGSDGLSCLAPRDTLYHCTSQTSQTTQCATCVALPTGYPDTCDPCVTVADGSYCGKDFPPTVVPQPASDPADKSYLFVCQAHRTTNISQPCVNGCGGTGPTAHCL